MFSLFKRPTAISPISRFGHFVVVLGLLNVGILTADPLQLAQEAFFKGNDKKTFSTLLPLAKKGNQFAQGVIGFYLLQRDGYTDLMSLGAQNPPPPGLRELFLARWYEQQRDWEQATSMYKIAKSKGLFQAKDRLISDDFLNKKKSPAWSQLFSSSTRPALGAFFRTERFKEIFKQNGSASLGFQNDSNVTQTPDGDTLNSSESGSHIDANLSLNFEYREGKGRKGLKYHLGLGKTDYLDSKFTNRQSENVVLGVSLMEVYPKTSTRLNSTKKLQIRHDYLDATKRRELGFRTITAGMLNVYKPKIKKWGYDVIIPVFNVDLEYRDFLNSLGTDTLGNKRDTTTPQLLALAVGTKKRDELLHKTTAMLLIRNSYSSSKDQAYLDSRLNLNHAVEKGPWEHSGSLGYVRRDQSNYQGVSREDLRWEFGLNSRYKWHKGKYQAKASLKFEDQRSNIVQFVYDSTSFSLEMKASW